MNINSTMFHFIGFELQFPPANLADEDGLLAMGGDLSTERLLLAYRSGIFPWYNEDELIQWWSPDPRFILRPEELIVSKSMQQLLRKKPFTFTINKAFEQVIQQCSGINRPGQEGTWIVPDMIAAYTNLHKMGHAISAEVWQDGQLVGGLYGVLINKIFGGESMFAKVSNASKYAFICLVRHLAAQGITLIDCQIHTSHLESLGARPIPRETFLALVAQNNTG